MHAVLNWLWQGTLVALALLGMLHLMGRTRANVRYVVCWVTLLFVVALPAIPWLLSQGPTTDVLPLLPAEAVVSVPDTWWTSGAIVGVLWSAWVLVHAVRLASAMVALRRARGHARPFPAQFESALAHWRAARTSGRRPRLVLSDAVSAAAVLGGGAPVIAVAPSLLTTLDAADLDRVVIHEWSHVQRRDDLLDLLQVVIRMVAGWHPAVRWIDRRLQIEREVACDEMAVAVTGSPKSYAACLLTLAGVTREVRMPLAAPAARGARSLPLRVTRIVSASSPLSPVRSRALAGSVVSALGAVALAAGGSNFVAPEVLALPFASAPPATAIRPPQPLVPPPSGQMTVTAAMPAAARPPAAAARPRAEAAAPSSSSSPQREAPVAAPPPAPAHPPAQSTIAPVTPESPDAEPATRGPEAAPRPDGASTSLPVASAAASPWAEASDGGRVIGRKSKEAGLATAGAFTRLARRIAGSF
jgi:beta-lactamase regulating signal transducer with metallopeptidase domain